MSYSPTTEQSEAISIHDRNLIVVAGAGSGKTRVLVARYIMLLEANPDWPISALVAITFTEKAAREMQDRVRQEIERRIADAADNVTLQRWRDCQATLDSARIGTIHALCASVLRANAAEITDFALDPGFQVLDELQAAILADEAVEQALVLLSETDQPVGRLLIEYDIKTIRTALRQALSWRIERLTVPDVTLWQQVYERHIITLIENLLADQEFLAAIHWQPPREWPKAPDKIMQQWQLIHETYETLNADNWRQTLTTWAKINMQGGSEKAWGDPLIFQAAKDTLKFIRDRVKSLLEEIGEPFGLMDEKAAELVGFWTEAIYAAQAVYQNLKQGQRALDFDDLETLTSRLLTQNPVVAARYRSAEFRHILVDEFQDTNSAQRDIIYALTGQDEPSTQGNLFVVGDPKQSIYAFRGADVSVFQRVQADIRATGGYEISLSTSFRSHTHLVEGFNVIFSALFGVGRADYEVTLGEPMRAQRPSELHHSPCLEIIVIDQDNADEDRHSAEDMRQWEAWTLAARLRELVDTGLNVWDGNAYRPLHYGDIAVLFQSSRSMPVVEDTFKATNIPYVTIAGKGYYDRPEVLDVSNLLKALYNPADDLSLAAALRSPLYSFSDDDLLALRLQRTPGGNRLTLWNALTAAARHYDPALPDPTRVVFARQSLQRLARSAGRITIAELISRILDETAYLATLSGSPDGVRRVGNVEKLLEMARQNGQIGLGAFTAYLQDLTDREAREGEALIETEGAVRLMTVHASKGLEFPVVALFDASWEGRPHESTLLYDPDLGLTCSIRDEDGDKQKPLAFRMAQHHAAQREAAERKRLLYVGMTRAREYVIVSGRNNGKGPWLRQLIETLGLPESIKPDENRLMAQPWGECLLRIPLTQPTPEQLTTQAENTLTAWHQLTDQPLPDIDSYEPPLLRNPVIDWRAPALTLSAKEIAMLADGRAASEAQSEPDSRFKNHILRGAPVLILEVANPDFRLNIPRRIIGEIVHQALRWWRLPSNTPTLDKILENYAWELGIIDPQRLNAAVEEAHHLLELTEKNWIIDQIAQAAQVYRELPFTFKAGERTINGVIDVLFFAKNKHWHIVDYKTSTIPTKDFPDLPTAVKAHAKRYHGQVGIYATAIEQLTGQPPAVHLYYPRYVYNVLVDMADWKAALNLLDADIAAALAE